MTDFSFKILNEKKKEVKVTYKNKSLKFQLKIKRSFTVLKRLLRAYPKFINIHSLDSVLNDPNRAHSDLRIANGFANFLMEKKNSRGVMHVKLNIKKLFEVYRDKNSKKFLSLSGSLRKNLSKEQQNNLYKSFDGKCNITGIKLHQNLKGSYFFKHCLMASYDHRRPISKKGTNELSNWQLISKLANDEKNKICNICDGKNCEKCALAHPEKFNIIQFNKQDISGLRIKAKNKKPK